MAGEAKTTNFMLGSATVMVGPQADLFNLNPAAHSIGLVKNFTLTQDPQYVELTQGVQNAIVDSALTSNKAKATMEVYEATAKNILYGLGLDGSTLTATGVKYTPTAAVAAAAVTVIIATDLTSNFAIGDWIKLQEGDDKVHIAKLTAVAFSTPNTTLTFTGYPVPTGVTFAAATTKVSKQTQLSVGSNAAQPYLAAKVVGTLSNGEVMTLLIPKMRIVNGFSLAFSTEQYGNLPFEFTPYAQTASDPMYSKFPVNPEAAVQIMSAVA
jgi:hypothetical protein